MLCSRRCYHRIDWGDFSLQTSSEFGEFPQRSKSRNPDRAGDTVVAQGIESFLPLDELGGVPSACENFQLDRSACSDLTGPDSLVEVAVSLKLASFAPRGCISD